MPLTKSQIQRLGERLGHIEPPDPADLELLDEFEQSFEAALHHVVRLIRGLGLDPTTRLKTRRSIVAKIRRQHTSLSRMQDIAGCRIVLEDVMKQEEVLDRLRDLPWDGLEVDDRRLRPSHGYRAVHVIVTLDGRPVEIQVRTRLQDLWAQVSEKMADRFGLDVKYGRGPARVTEFLAELADPIGKSEDVLLRLASYKVRYVGRDEELNPELEALRTDVEEYQSDVGKRLNELLVTLSS